MSADNETRLRIALEGYCRNVLRPNQWGFVADQIEKIIAANSVDDRAPTPYGFVIAPLEATQSMIMNSYAISGIGGDAARKIYRAMIDTAPPAPATPDPKAAILTILHPLLDLGDSRFPDAWAVKVASIVTGEDATPEPDSDDLWAMEVAFSNCKGNFLACLEAAMVALRKRWVQ